MHKYSLEELQEKYDFDLAGIVESIKQEKAKLVLLQFPDGFKPYSISIVDYFREKTKAAPLGVHQIPECGCIFLVWFSSCYGACDSPVLPKGIERDIDLIFQFGHNNLMPSY